MTDLKDVVAVSGVRTPMGRFGGTFRDMPVYDIGAAAIRAALEKAGVGGKQVSEVIYGCCRQAGNGPNPARTASVRGGVPVEIPVQTVNMACPSGMMCVSLAAKGIMAGDGDIYVVGGMESMSTIPYLLKGVRWEGFRMGDKTLMDGWGDSIDPLCGCGMGMTAENLVERHRIPREEQDLFAVESHLKAARAWEQGLFAGEVIPVEVPPASKKGGPVLFSKDETIRADANMEAMARLKPAFKTGGTVTPGNACGMSDGAAALVMTSREKAKALGAGPLFSIVAYAAAAVDPSVMGEGPGYAIPMALERAGMALGDMDFIEVNEAFAVQVLVNERKLGWDRAKLNVHGGAIALGHPTGISGARILVTLYNVLRSRNAELGIAAICGGGGVTMAMIIKREL
jgi:acetyl-CoA C-acetyltransferase